MAREDMSALMRGSLERANEVHGLIIQSQELAIDGRTHEANVACEKARWMAGEVISSLEGGLEHMSDSQKEATLAFIDRIRSVVGHLVEWSSEVL